jgi:hypothetical protein
MYPVPGTTLCAAPKRMFVNRTVPYNISDVDPEWFIDFYSESDQIMAIRDPAPGPALLQGKKSRQILGIHNRPP